MVQDSRPPGRVKLSAAITDEVHGERLESLRGLDNPDGRELARAIGAAVVSHRTRRGMSQDQLSAASGIGLDLLVRLEQGDDVPSLRAVWLLATALEVPFAALLKESEVSPATDFHVQRVGEGRVITSSTGDFSSRVLYPEGDARAPEVYELTLAPGCVEEAMAHADGTCEHLTVVRGTLVVRTRDQEARLEPGDSLFFTANAPHSYHNPGIEDVVALLVMNLFGADDRQAPV